MFSILSSLRYEYKLLYLRTSLLSNINGFSSLSKLRFENNHFISHQFNVEQLFNKKSFKTNKLKTFSFFLKQLDVPSNYFSFIRKHRSSFVRILTRNLKQVKSRSCSKSSSLARYNFSFLFPLRILNLSSSIYFTGRGYKHAQLQDILKQVYSRFFFLYPSCSSDEIKLTSFLRFLFSNYSFSDSFSSSPLLLNRLLINSFFFSKKKASSQRGRFRSKKSSRVSKLISKRKFFSYKRSKILLCSMFNLFAKRKVGHIKKRNVGSFIFYKLLRYRKGHYWRYRKSLVFKRRKLHKFARLSSRFYNLNFFSYDNSSLYPFIHTLNRLIYRCSVVKSKSFYSFPFSRVMVNSRFVANTSTASLFSFYKKHHLSKLGRFLKRIRVLKDKTYNLHLKETGSNIYSTFMHKNRMLFSMWSGRFGLKKRLKYRKKAGHKISHHFHRFISNMYKKKEISKLNFIVKGFPKFFEICLEALSRQIAYSQTYHINIRKHHKLLRRAARHTSSFYWKPFRNKLSSSFLKSFMLPLVYSSTHVNLNGSDLHHLIPELSSNDILLLNKVINSDNSQRSDLLLRVLRTRRYKRNFRAFSASFDANRSLLVNKLIGIFMIRYGLNSKKDFYKSVSYLNKYKSSIFNYPNSDKSDFMSAYAILYLLKILKQNRLYFSKLVASFSRLRRKFARYSGKLRSFTFRFFSKKRRRRLVLKSNIKKHRVRKLNVGSRYGYRFDKHKHKHKHKRHNPTYYRNNNVFKRSASQKQIQMIRLKRNKKFKTLPSRLSSYMRTSSNRSSVSNSLLEGGSLLYLFNSFCVCLLRRLKFKFKSKSKLKLKRRRFYNKVKNKNKTLLRQALFFIIKRPNHSFSNYLRSVLIRAFVFFVRRSFGKRHFNLSSRSRIKLFNYFFLKKVKALFVSKLSTKVKRKKKPQSFSKFNKKVRFKRRRKFRSGSVRSLRKSLVRISLLRLLNRFASLPPYLLRGVSSSRRFLNSNRKRSRFRSKLKRLRFFRNGTRHSLLLRRLRLRRARTLIRKKKRRRFSLRARIRSPRKYWMFTSRRRRSVRLSNGKRRKIMPRFKFSASLRSIRTRMRNFIRLSTTFGYVKCRSSLSHGGCSSRKRSYDKRYIF